MITKAQAVSMPGTGDITHLLEAMHEGDPAAGEELLSHGLDVPSRFNQNEDG